MAKHNRNRLKKLYNWHAWVGFHLAVLMFVILCTGTIATVSNEIDWLIFDELRASPKPEGRSSNASADDWAAIYSSVKQRYPNGQPLSLFNMGEDYLTYRVVVKDDAIENAFVHVDQWTLDVTGTVPRFTVQRFFRDFHRYLFMPAFPGIVFVCAMAFVLAISIYTGLKTTKNWRKALFRIRFKKDVRVTLSDLHKFMGLWGIWFSLVICTTGIWYFYEFGFRVAGSSVEPAGPSILQAYEEPLTLSTTEFETIIREAQQAHKGWHITSIFIPETNAAPIQLRGVKNNPLLRDRAYRVFIHPDTFEIIGTFTPDSIGVNAYLNEYADPLHFGAFGGLWTKLIWFVFGVALTGMSVTGVVMTWKRTNSSALSKAQIYTLPILVLAAIAFYFYIGRYT